MMLLAFFSYFFYGFFFFFRNARNCAAIKSRVGSNKSFWVGSKLKWHEQLKAAFEKDGRFKKLPFELAYSPDLSYTFQSGSES
jgi:hypothetical protein